MQLILTGELISAEEAQRIGLVNQVVPAEGLQAAAEQWVEAILACAPLALQAGKEAAVRGLELPLWEAVNTRFPLAERMYESDDFIEGPKAFAEKRKPVWKGKIGKAPRKLQRLRKHCYGKICPLEHVPRRANRVHPQSGRESALPTAVPRCPTTSSRRMRNVSITQAWGRHTRAPATTGSTKTAGFARTPVQVLVGRALTAMYMPRRPVMRQVMEEKRGAGRLHRRPDSRGPLIMLVPGDVYVADVFGKNRSRRGHWRQPRHRHLRQFGQRSGPRRVRPRYRRHPRNCPISPVFVRGFHPTFCLAHHHADRGQLPSAHRRCHSHARRRSPRPRRWRRLHTASPSRTGGQDLRVDLAPRPLWQNSA